MKRILLWLVLALLFSYETAMAQMEMQVTLTRATSAPFPTSAMAYYNNPMNYFNLTITPLDGRAHDIFISMTLSSDATTTRIWTDERFVGTMPKISIPSMGKRIGSVEFVQHFNRRLNTNLSESYRGVSDLTLPEGTYHLCIDVHDYYDTANVIGHSCMDFDICYSGLAPELTSPHLTASTSGGYDKLIPSKKTNFSWTGVVSNCFEPNAFDYVIQFVEVYPGQNVQEAVESNPVLTALDCGRRTFFTYDYHTNPYLRLDSGGVYAVMVEAVPADPDRLVNLSNDGKSQYMVFVWCGPNTSGIGGNVSTASGGGGGAAGSTTGNGDGVSDTKITMKDNKSAVLRSLRKPNIVSPRPFATVDGSGALGITATSVKGDSVSKADYVISLYEYVGDTSVSMSRPPMKQTVLPDVTAHDGNPIEMVSDWSSDLVKGNQYMVTLKADVTFRYSNTYRIRKVDFIDKFPEINRYDSVVGAEGHTDMTSVAIFKWGEGADDYSVLTAPEILNLGHGTANNTTLKLKKADLKELVWKESKFDGSHSDLVVYDIYVYELGSESTPIYQMTGVDKTVANVRDLQENVLAGHTYKVVVRARMYYDQVGSENSVDSKAVLFEIKNSNASSYNTTGEMFRLKGGMLFDDEQPETVMRGRTAMAPAMEQKSEPDSARMNFASGGKDSQGNPNKTSVYRGFKSDRLINSAKGVVSKNAKATISAQLDMFTLDGELSQLPSGGWGGPVKVTLMDGVSATMNVGLGTAKDNNGQSYDWWYIYGEEQYSEPKTVGALTVSGFGGVFAHNMAIANSEYLSKTAEELVSCSYNGVRFYPQKGAWVAKGGIRMALENKNLLDACGAVALALENGHFSRLYVDMGAKRLSDDNPLMERDCQNVFTYEITQESHMLHLIQLPVGVRCEFKYSGLIVDGGTVNVGFGTLVPNGSVVRENVARPAFRESLPIQLDIETWRRGGQPQWYAKIGGKPGTSVELGNKRVLYNAGQSAGTRAAVDAYKFEKDLASALPSAAKSEAMQSNATARVISPVTCKPQAGALAVLKGSNETASEQLSSSESRDALLTCLLGTRVDFEGWHGDVSLVQSVLPVEVVNEDNNATSILPQSNLPFACSDAENVFSFFRNVEFSDVNARTGNVSPFAKCRFSTAYPVSYRRAGKSSSVNEIMVADMNGARRFCLSMNEAQRGQTGTSDMHYAYDSDNDMVSAEQALGGFESGKLNSVTLCANLYEKRNPSDFDDDRVVDIFTGEEKGFMKGRGFNWGLPLCGGTPQRSSIEKTLQIVTDVAPYTLDNQVLFTWPYNGDPFVPNEEIDSACYIFFKHNRDDLFDGRSLTRKGKILRAFVVNQELGIVNAADCRYEYFPTKGDGKESVPYLKVYMPKAVVKTKNSAGTYSPCCVSLMVIDTAEYAKAYKECVRKAAYSSEPFSEYSVCRQVGTRVYNLYFRFDHMYSTYKVLMDTISAESARIGVGIGYGADNVTVDPSNSLITSKLSSINLNRYFAFRNRSYIFDDYTPNDISLYASGVTLPPIAVFAVNGRQSIDEFFNNSIPEWLAVNESFYYQYAHLLFFQQRAKWLMLNKYPVLYDPSVRIANLNLLAPASMRVSHSDGLYLSMSENELIDIFTSGNSIDRGNLTPLQATHWFHEGSQMRPAYGWNVPALLQVSSDLVNRVSAAHFKSTEHIKSVTFVNPNPVICIQDRVSPAIMKENKAFASFFAQIHSYAEWYENLDENERREVRESLSVSDAQHGSLKRVRQVFLSLDDSPFDLPKASLLTAYDSWSRDDAQFKNRDYWFDNWIRSNQIDGYAGIKPAWTSPWISSDFSANNTEQYRQAKRRNQYRQYVVNSYYLTLNDGENSFLNTVFIICRDALHNNEQLPALHHNALSDARISIHVPYNKAVKSYISPEIKFGGR